MQLSLPWTAVTRKVVPRPVPPVIEVAGHAFPLVIARHRRARRYLLRVTDDGRLRLTVPRGASVAAGLRFVESQAVWISGEWARRQAAADWRDGTVIWHQGVATPLRVSPQEVVWADERVALLPGATVRAAVQRHLRDHAPLTLVARCAELAARTGLSPRRIAVRDQRSRWGSCSGRGAIMLNWRLIQMPSEVCDYIMLHELVHLIQPNHSRRFWRAVAAVCPGWRSAEQWLRRHGHELM